MLRILQKYIGLGILVATLLTGQTAPRRSSNAPPPPPDQAAVDRGHALFGQTCGFCHGKEANGGDGGPDLIRSVLVNHDEHGEQITPVILNGRPDKGMPKFNLTSQQISDISAFLRARNRYVRYRQLYQVKDDVVTGDARAGENYFNGAGKCVTCHSPSGDLAHIAAKLEPEALMIRFLYPNQRRAKNATAATVDVKLSTGEAFSGPLKHMDEFTVSMYDSSGNYHTWPRETVNVEVHDPLAAHLELLPKYTDEEMRDMLAYLVTLK